MSSAFVSIPLDSTPAAVPATAAVLAPTRVPDPVAASARGTTSAWGTTHILAAIKGVSDRSRDTLRIAARCASNIIVPLSVTTVSDTDIADGVDVDAAIARTALARSASVIVIGRGQSVSGRLLTALKSRGRAARICEAANTPVIAVSPYNSGNDPLDTLVIATDFSPASWTAAVTALRAAPPGVRAHVVHVVTDPIVPGECERMRAKLAGWMAPLTAFLPNEGHLALSILTGDPYHALATFLSNCEATAVAVGMHRPRQNAVAVLGRTVPERLLATWPGSMILAPYHEWKTP